MTELLENAWTGWLQFTGDGKLAAVLLSSLLFLWLCGKWKDQKTLFVYTAVMTLCCIVPMSAVLLMVYQTRFYDYEWIWSFVPLTVVASWGCTLVLDRFWPDFELRQLRHGLPVAILLAAVFLLCGGMGYQAFDKAGEREERARAEEVLAQVTERQEGEVYLWAPREILEYARAVDGSIRLLYGRNMWENSLDAYAYDVYDPKIRALYLWMENMDETGEAVTKDGQQEEAVFSGKDCMDIAAAWGVNCILLPGGLMPETVKSMADALGGSVYPLEDYYLLTR